MAASLTTAGAGAAALEVSTPAAGGAGHQQPGGKHDSDGRNLTADNMVAFSSRLIAAIRAAESRKADRLFHDPFAELLAGPDLMRLYNEGGKARDEEASAPPDAPDSTDSAIAADGEDWRTLRDIGMLPHKRLAVRTRFCDDFFEDCAGPRGIKQIVLVGAGMDTRGLRLKTAPGTKVFEVDQALVLRVKSALLSKAPATEASKEKDGGVGQAQVVAVAADLSKAGWEGELLEAGFDPNQPSAWILEGLTMYLDEQEILRLLHTISKHCAPNSAFCATSASEGTVAIVRAKGGRIYGTWKWGCDDPQAFYEANFPVGWVFKGTQCGTPGEYPDGADYGVVFHGKGSDYVVGFFSAALEGE